MEKKNIRQDFGRWAGGCYLLGNFGMTFKGVIDEAAQGHDIDWSDLYADPFSAAIGLTFIAAAYKMARSADDTKGMRVSQILAFTGYGMLGGQMAFKGYPAASVIGAGAGLLSSGYAVYMTFKQEKDAKKKQAEETPVQEKKSAFLENIAGITKKFPYLLTGAIDFACNALLMAGAVASKDAVLGVIAGIWCAATGLFATALPKVPDSKALSENKPI